jgi:hypothetical protein
VKRVPVVGCRGGHPAPMRSPSREWRIRCRVFRSIEFHQPAPRCRPAKNSSARAVPRRMADDSFDRRCDANAGPASGSRAGPVRPDSYRTGWRPRPGHRRQPRRAWRLACSARCWTITASSTVVVDALAKGAWPPGPGEPVRLRARAAGIVYDHFCPREKWRPVALICQDSGQGRHIGPSTRERPLRMLRTRPGAPPG